MEFRLLREDEIELRVGIQGVEGVSLLLYKDSRCDMTILDETVQPENWQRAHSRDNANCTVSIWDAAKGQWISKEDTGTASRTESEKGLASDSFKRACVNWGIGRELYSSPFVWVRMNKLPTRQRNGKTEVMADRLHVSHIEYDKPSRKITALDIVNSDTGEVVFTWSKSIPIKPVPAGVLDSNDSYAKEHTASSNKGVKVAKTDKVPPHSVDRRAHFDSLKDAYGVDDKGITTAINKAVESGIVTGLQGDIGSMSDTDFIRLMEGASTVLKGMTA